MWRTGIRRASAEHRSDRQPLLRQIAEQPQALDVVAEVRGVQAVAVVQVFQREARVVAEHVARAAEDPRVELAVIELGVEKRRALLGQTADGRRGTADARGIEGAPRRAGLPQGFDVQFQGIEEHVRRGQTEAVLVLEGVVVQLRHVPDGVEIGLLHQRVQPGRGGEVRAIVLCIRQDLPHRPVGRRQLGIREPNEARRHAAVLPGHLGRRHQRDREQIVGHFPPRQPRPRALQGRIARILGRVQQVGWIQRQAGSPHHALLAQGQLRVLAYQPRAIQFTHDRSGM